jgi:hypothetical protein
MWSIWQDLRYSARLLRKHPGFTLTAVGVLALGIGVNAGIFGIINGLMIRPLAGADAPGEVVGVFSKDRTTERGYRASYPGFSDLRDAGGPFVHLAGHTVALAGVTENDTTRQATVAIVTSVREQLRAADANLPVIFVKSFRAQHEGSAQVWILRAAAKMFLTLGLAGTFVAVIGLYGVRSYLVSRRTREFGGRMAIGASPADVRSLVVRETLATTTVGLTIGLGLALVLGWGLRAAIYQISPFDPVTLGTATGILAISSLAASVIPARRAANVLPMAALRHE